MIIKNLDQEVLNMFAADEIRVGMIPLASRMIYLVESPWTMVEDPYCIEWVDDRTGESCAIPLIGVPLKGKEFVLVSTYDDIGEVKLYAFYRNQYYTMED